MRLPPGGLLVLASDNPGKAREIACLLSDLPLEVRSQREYGVPAAKETGLSFVENAILKARQACRYTGLPAIADDSGLEVDALDGAPGIYSARYAGPKATDEENLRKLLDVLKEIPEPERTARFQCAIVYLRHADDPMPVVCQGTWEGRILFAPRGENGFGYDPIFWVPTHGCSAAELDPETKNQISHRGQALRRLREWFIHGL